MMYFGLGECARDEAPLHAGGEARAAAAAQGGSFHLIDDLLGRHAHGFVEGLVAVVGEIGVDRGGVRQTEALGQDSGFEGIGFVIDHLT